MINKVMESCFFQTLFKSLNVQSIHRKIQIGQNSKEIGLSPFPALITSSRDGVIYIVKNITKKSSKDKDNSLIVFTLVFINTSPMQNMIMESQKGYHIFKYIAIVKVYLNVKYHIIPNSLVLKFKMKYNMLNIAKMKSTIDMGLFSFFIKDSISFVKQIINS